jgi:tetratricopeptide (TPR) repeat protein
LCETAREYEAHKYIAVSHKLLAQSAIAEGDLATAEKEYLTALAELKAYPAPVVAWKIYAELGRLRRQLGDHSGAREALTQAAQIVRAIAEEITDETLRATFVDSKAVREALNVDGANEATA